MEPAPAKEIRNLKTYRQAVRQEEHRHVAGVLCSGRFHFSLGLDLVARRAQTSLAPPFRRRLNEHSLSNVLHPSSNRFDQAITVLLLGDPGFDF
jgi:hypothetical protein